MRHLRRAIQRLIRRTENKGRADCTQRAPVEVFKLPLTFQDAAKALSTPSVVQGLDYREKVVKTVRDGTHPKIVEFYQKFNRELKNRGIPMYAFCFYRSAKRQNNLYAMGNTKAKAGDSPHNWGLAVDIVHTQRFWDLTPREWAVIGAIGKEVARRMKLKVNWGGDWDFYDPAHWQLENWKEYREEQRKLNLAGVTFSKEEDRFAELDRLVKQRKKRKR